MCRRAETVRIHTSAQVASARGESPKLSRVRNQRKNFLAVFMGHILEESRHPLKRLAQRVSLDEFAESAAAGGVVAKKEGHARLHERLRRCGVFRAFDVQPTAAAAVFDEMKAHRAAGAERQCDLMRLQSSSAVAEGLPEARKRAEERNMVFLQSIKEPTQARPPKRAGLNWLFLSVGRASQSD